MNRLKETVKIGSITYPNYISVVNDYTESFDYINGKVNNMINELLEENIPISIIIGLTRRNCNKIAKEIFNENDKKIIHSLNTHSHIKKCNNNKKINNEINTNNKHNDKNKIETILDSDEKSELNENLEINSEIKQESKKIIVIKIKN